MGKGRPRIRIVLALFAVSAVTVAWWFISRANPIATRVDELFAKGKVPDTQELWELGPEVIPHVASKARAHETPLTKAYAFVWKKLPKLARTRLPAPVDKAKLRAAAMRVIQ